MKLEINIPTDLNEIALGDFQLYWQSEQSAFDKLHYLLKLTPSTINLLNAKQVFELDEVIDNLLNSEVNFQQRINIAGIEFGFIPNLEQMTFEEFTTLDVNLSQIEDLHNALAVLYRPIIEENGIEYTVAPYKADTYEDIMKQMPLGCALGSKVFFYRIGMDCTNVLTSYSEKEAEEMISAMKHNLASVGDGIEV